MINEHPREQWEQNFRNHLVHLRELRDMTQTDVAKALASQGLKFHQQTIQRIEAGERPVRLDEAYLIAKVFDVGLDVMTSPLVSASHDEVVFMVDRLRRLSGDLADELRPLLDDWADEVDTFVMAVDDLNPEKGEKTPLVRWALEWTTRFNEITTKLLDAMGEAGWNAGRSEVERFVAVDSVEVVHSWIEGRVWNPEDELSIEPNALAAWIRENRG